MTEEPKPRRTRRTTVAAAPAAAVTAQRTGKRTKQGVVVSDKMDKTVVVAVEHLRRHRLYGRHVRRTHKFKAHDETNECRIGDAVIIEEARPMSRDKRWRVQKVLRSTFVADIDAVAAAPQIEGQEAPTPEAPAEEASE